MIIDGYKEQLLPERECYWCPKKLERGDEYVQLSFRKRGEAGILNPSIEICTVCWDVCSKDKIPDKENKWKI